MSRLLLKYEILVSGIYPFDGVFEKCGFTIAENTINEALLNELFEESTIYFSPFIGMCCYPNSTGTPVYLTLQKEEEIEIDYNDREEYDVAFTNQYMDSLNLFESAEILEKTMVMEVNNNIKFPIKLVRAYDPEGNFVTLLVNFMKLNVPSLLSNNQEHTLEVMKRQNNRLNSGISYEKVIELSENNNFFKNALSMYYSSFSVSDHNVGFTLLVIALESLLGLGTYSKVERCECCGQRKYAITSTISQNVSTILMDQDDTIKRRIKKLYDVRSQYVHNGTEIEQRGEQEIQEYVRKVLLMYWFVSMYIKKLDHKAIMKEILSKDYKENIMYQSFLTGLDNTSFEEKRTQILKDILSKILDSSKGKTD